MRDEELSMKNEGREDVTNALLLWVSASVRARSLASPHPRWKGRVDFF